MVGELKFQMFNSGRMETYVALYKVPGIPNNQKEEGLCVFSVIYVTLAFATHLCLHKAIDLVLKT
jgi:hypothetical protein